MPWDQWVATLSRAAGALTATDVVDIQESPDAAGGGGSPVDAWTTVAAGLACRIVPGMVHDEVVGMQLRTRIDCTVIFYTPVALGIVHRLVVHGSPTRYLIVRGTTTTTAGGAAREWIVLCDEYPDAAGGADVSGVVPSITSGEDDAIPLPGPGPGNLYGEGGFGGGGFGA